MFDNISRYLSPIFQGYQFGLYSTKEEVYKDNELHFMTRVCQIFQINIANQMAEKACDSFIPGFKLNQTFSSICWYVPLITCFLKEGKFLNKNCLSIINFIDSLTPFLALVSKVVFVSSTILLIANGQVVFGGIALGMTGLCYLEKKNVLPKSMNSIMNNAVNPAAKCLLFFYGSTAKKIELVVNQLLPFLNWIGAKKNPLIEKISDQAEENTINALMDRYKTFNKIEEIDTLLIPKILKVDSNFVKYNAIPKLYYRSHKYSSVDQNKQILLNWIENHSIYTKENTETFHLRNKIQLFIDFNSKIYEKLNEVKNLLRLISYNEKLDNFDIENFIKESNPSIPQFIERISADRLLDLEEINFVPFSDLTPIKDQMKSDSYPIHELQESIANLEMYQVYAKTLFEDIKASMGEVSFNQFKKVCTQAKIDLDQSIADQIKTYWNERVALHSEYRPPNQKIGSTDQKVVDTALQVLGAIQAWKEDSIIRYFKNRFHIIGEFSNINQISSFLSDFMRKVQGLNPKYINDFSLLKELEKTHYWSIWIMLKAMSQEFSYQFEDPQNLIRVVATALSKGDISDESFMNWWSIWLDRQEWEESDPRRAQFISALQEAKESLMEWSKESTEDIENLDNLFVVHQNIYYKTFYPFIRYMLLEMGIFQSVW